MITRFHILLAVLLSWPFRFHRSTRQVPVITIHREVSRLRFPLSFFSSRFIRFLLCFAVLKPQQMVNSSSIAVNKQRSMSQRDRIKLISPILQRDVKRERYPKRATTGGPILDPCCPCPFHKWISFRSVRQVSCTVKSCERYRWACGVEL